jgi:hypothetical protein
VRAIFFPVRAASRADEGNCRPKSSAGNYFVFEEW